MKLISSLTFTVDDIKELLKLANPKLPLGKKLNNGIDIRVMRAGSQSNCFFFDGKKAVGVAVIQREKIVTIKPAANGLHFVKVGLLKDYQGLGIMFRAMNSLC